MEFYLWCSPRTRGWTIHPPDGAADERVFPAHAGMDRPGRSRSGGWPTVFPAHAGMDRKRFCAGWRSACVPRARGDGPLTVSAKTGNNACSPRTRGWTDLGDDRKPVIYVFPAHAGMDRWRTSCATATASCSPRTRGWTVERNRALGGAAGVPRARGDGPAAPRLRGPGPRVFPAHAGMDRNARRGCGALHCVFPAHAGMDRGPRGALSNPPGCSPRTRGWTGG